MKTLTYNIDDEECFDYEIDRDEMRKRLYQWFLDEWSHDDLIDYIINSDGTEIDLEQEFEEIIYELFEDDALEFYYETKDEDNGVDQEDFLND